MATCGNCKATSVSVGHVRACYGQVGAVATMEREVPAQDLPWQRTGSMASPDWELVNNLRHEVSLTLVREAAGKLVGYYALRGSDGVVKFYRIKKVLKGRWQGRVFVDAQASDEYHPVKSAQSLAHVLGGILRDPDAAARLYASELGCCSRCARTLTDETSRARGIGPDCWKLG